MEDCMPRPSKTGVKGLYQNKDGQYEIDLRWNDPATGAAERHIEKLPSATKLAAAKERARTILSAALAGKFKQQTPTVSLKAMFKEYCKWSRDNRPRTAEDRARHAEVFIEFFGDVALDTITARRVEEFRQSRTAKKNSHATINRYLATLKHAYGIAEKWGWISREAAAPVRTTSQMKEPSGRVRFLSADAEAALLPHIPRDLRLLVDTARHSGMRLSETIGLRWSHVDINGRSITLHQTKNGEPRRVQMNTSLATLLKDLVRPISNSEHVFVRANGDAWNRHAVTKAFARAVAAAGLDDFRYHDLRHDFATKLRKKGIGLDAIAKLLGHKSLTMASRYAHLDDPKLQDAVCLLDSADDPAPEASADATGTRTK
jgi:integrase